MPRRNLIILLVALAASWLCYQRAARNRYAATLAEAMNIVSARYINEVEPRVLFEGAMDGMVDKLDSYSAYTSPEEFDEFQQQMDGAISGIGVLVESDTGSGYLVVLEAIVGKPAYLAGIRAGDKIVAIDGKPTKEMTRREAVRLIRGQPGTTVTIRVEHVGRSEPAEHTLERATIPVESVVGDYRSSDGKWVFRLFDHPRIGYIRIINFGERTTDEFQEALASYRSGAEPVDGLIVDLRYNAGGLLTAATEICDALLEDGLIVTTRGRNEVILEQHSATPGTELPPDVPMVVLVDQLSASASEIVAACLQDHGRAAIAGRRTWGKGTVQQVIALEGSKSAMRLTIGSYRRPSGKEIHKWKKSQESDDWGVRPDPGLDVPLTSRQNDVIIEARRKRDLMAREDLQMHPASGQPPMPLPDSSLPPVPTPETEEESQAEQARAIKAEAAAAAKRDPALIDLQLKHALEHLSQKS